MDQGRVLDISWASILKIAVAAVGIYFLYLIGEFLAWFAFAFVISVLFEPAIERLGKWKVPRVLAVVFLYLLIFGLLSVVIYLVLPYFISEIQYFSQVFPQQFSEYFSKISPFFVKLGIDAFQNMETFLIYIQSVLREMGSNIFSAVFVIFGGIFSAIFMLSIAIFLSLEKKSVEKALVLLFPKKYEDYVLNAWIKSQKKITGWFLIRIIGCVFVGAASYITFLFLNVQYPLSLALVAGVCDFVPIIGPFFAAAIAFIFVSIDSFLKAVFVICAFILIQLIENGVLIPFLSRKVINVSSVLVLIALFIGGKFWGQLGAILFVPLVAILFDFLKDFLEARRNKEIQE